MEPKVIFENVSKTYNFYEKQTDKLMDILSLQKKSKSFSALRNISFEVYKGESIGVIGINGSGKSTLSNLLAQVVEPTTGTVKINGESSLIAISAGLNNNLSGYENIELKCLMLGLKKEEITKITPQIVEFADIGDFIHQPVKNYSSGMKSRLGFAISIHTNPDILIVDEALSVGDQTFYQKCINKMEEFKKQGKTIFFISHSISQIRSFCDRVLWLHFGEIKEFGDKETVLKNYKEFIDWFNSLNEHEKKEYRARMLQEQFSEEKRNLQRSTRSSKKKKKKSFGWIFKGQVLLLFLCMLLSIYFMFSNNKTSFFLSDINKKLENANNVGENQANKVEENKKEVINSKGFIIKETVDVFSDKDLNNKQSTLVFATPIMIEEKVDNVYKIHHDDLSGYIGVNDAEIYQGDLEVKDYTIEDLLVFLPESFSNAYSFYLSHLGLPYDEVKANLRGLSQETIDPAGNKVQIYQSENVSFLFNKSNIAYAIIIYDLNSADTTFNNLVDSSNLSNNDEKLYFIRINNYEVIINLKTHRLILKLPE
jgi:teichoic acid transport system ATP-binding protein